MNSDLLKVARGGDIEPPLDLTKNLDAHYLLNNNGDDSYGIHDGTAMGNVQFLGDKAEFDGVNDYVKISEWDADRLYTQITMSVWVIPSLVQDGVIYNHLYTTGGAGSTSNSGCWLHLTSGGSFSVTHVMLNTESFENDDGYSGTSYAAINRCYSVQAVAGQLYHVVATINGNTSKLYIDGVLCATLTTVQPMRYATTGTDRPTITIGNLYYQDVTTAYVEFTGDISNVRVYDDVKEQSIITLLYEEGRYPKLLPLPTTDYLLAHYPLTGTAEDAYGVGGNESGTEYNGVSFVDESIFRGYKVAIFDGTNDYVDMGSSMDFNNTSFTISHWIKTTQTTVWRTFQNRGQGTSGTLSGFQISCSNNTDYSNTSVDDGLGNFIQLDNISYNESDGLWHNLTLTWDATIGKLELFVDGVSKGSKTNASLIGANLNGLNEILGRSSSSLEQFFNGSVSNLRIYTTVLSQSDITDLFNEGSDQTVIPIATDLLAHYKLDSDTSQYTNNGGVTLTDDATRGFVNSFNGTDGFIDYGSQVGGNTNFSISTWLLNDNNYSTRKCVLINNDCIFRIDDVGNMAIWDDRDGTGAYTILNYTLSNYLVAGWNHIVLSVEGTTYVLKINNVTVSYTTSTGTFASTLVNMTIGKDTRNNNNYFTSSLSDLRVYDRALTDIEITALFNEVEQASDYSYYFPLTGAVDETGTYNGTEFDSLVYSGEQRGESVSSFDGVDDYVGVPHTSPLSSASQSISGWFKTEYAGPDIKGAIYKASSTGPSVREFGIEINATGQLYFSMSDSIEIKFTASTSTNIRDGNWHHFVAVKSYQSVDDIISIYINGVFEASTTLSGHGYVGTNEIVFGKVSSISTSVRYMDGELSDFRIYDRVLTPDEITALYDEVDEPTLGLIAHYPLTIEARADDIWVSYDGTEVGGLTYIDDSVYGSVGAFDGLTGEIDLGTIAVGTPLQLTNDFTICGWLNPVGTGDDYQRIIDKSSAGTGTDGYTIYYRPSTQQLTYSSGGVSRLIVTATLPSNVWSFFSFKLSGSELTGEIDSGNTVIAYSIPKNDNVSTGLSIGTWPWSTEREFNGRVRNIRIYNKALSFTELDELYVQEKNFRPVDITEGLVAYYPLSKNSLDNYYNEYDGADTTMTYDEVGAIYNSSGDAIEVSNAPVLDFNALVDSYTFSLWLKGPTQTANYTILQKGTSLDIPVIMFGDALDVVYFRTYDGISASQATLSQTDVFDDTWHMVTFMVNIAADKVEVILDGTIYDDGPNNTQSSTYSTLPMYIGNDGNKNRAVNGSLAKLRIYDRVLTREEITLIYNLEKGDFGL